MKIAAKNLLRRRGRTLLTLMGVAIAISVLFSLLSLNSGYEMELNKEMNSLGANVLAVPKGCPYEAASLVIHGGVIPKFLNESDLQKIRNISGVELATPVLMEQFIKKNSITGKGEPHVALGINIDEYRQLKPWWGVQGRFFAGNETKVELIGRALSDKENITVGSVISSGPFKGFSTVGVLNRTGDQDDNFHFVPLAEAQRVFNKTGMITTIAIKVKDVNQIARVADDMEKIPDVQAVTMTQVTGTIMNLAGSAKSLLMTVIAIALIISAFGIINTLLMSVNERTKEFGMMKAIGASGLDIGKMVLAETLFITVSGGVIGTVGAIVGSSLIEDFVKGILPYSPAGSLIAISPELIAFCIGFSVVLGLICGLYPAFKSSRLTPMEAIRGGIE